MRCLHQTFLGGFLAHVMLITAWTLGMPLMLLPALIIWSGYRILGTSLLVIFCLQWLPLKPWLGFRRFIRYLDPTAYYEECRLVLVDEKDIQDEGSMICYHPHGVLCGGFSFCGCHHPEFAEGRHGDFVWLIAGSLTKLPFFQLVCKWMGNLQSASKKNLLRLMQLRKNIAFVPGGFQEATVMKRGSDVIWLKTRVGFIKYALVHGYRVHPCYVFGERDTFHTFQYFQKQRLRLNDFGFPGVAFFGDWRLPIFPKTSARIVTVIGKGLDLPKLDSLTKEDIFKWHAIYVKALKELFESQKVAAGYPNARLEIL